MKIGIIGPSEDEIMPFIEELTSKEKEDKAMLTFYKGKYKAIDVVALYCGVCKVNAALATQILIDKFHVTHIILTGVAGAIDNRLNIGDTVISTKVSYHDVNEDILTEYHPWMKQDYFKGDSSLIDLCKDIKAESNIYFGKIVTGEAFISDKGRKEIIEKFNPLCVDMETGSVAHVCYVNKIPFLAIRSITDTETECGVDVFEENCTLASKNSIEVLKKILDKI